MKKKLAFAFVLTFVIIFLGVALFGCGTSIVTRVEKNMAERTDVYYFGVGDNFYASIASGEREKDYFINGKCDDEKVDFALLTIKTTADSTKKVLSVEVVIDGEKKSFQLLKRPDADNTFQTDMELNLSGDEKISLMFDGENLDLENESKKFAIDSKKAIEIATVQLADKITECKKGNNLGAEGYLRVLDKKANNFDDMFWCFTVVNVEQKSYSVVISTVDGSVKAISE